jgi:hypothetical protein
MFSARKNIIHVPGDAQILAHRLARRASRARQEGGEHGVS